MRDTACKAAHRFHFLRLAELFFELFAVCNIQSHADGALHFSAGPAQRFHMACVRPFLPLHMKRDGFARDRTPVRRDGKKRLVGGLEIIREKHADDFIRLNAQPRQARAQVPR